MMDSDCRIPLVDGHFPWEVPFGTYLVTLRTEHTDDSLRYLPSGYPNHDGGLHLGEAVYAYPDYRRRGVWLKWEHGRRFVPCDQLGDADAVAKALLETGLRFNWMRRQLLCNYAAKAYAENTAVTPHDLAWPDEVLHEVDREVRHGF